MKKLTIRMEEEGYEKLKGYAEKRGESINDEVIEAVGKLISGSLPGPRPAPSPKPPPGSAPAAQAEIPEEIPEEIGKLPWRVKKLEEYHRQVSQVLSMVGGVTIPPMPKIPSPPFSVSSRRTARGKAGEKREKMNGRWRLGEERERASQSGF